jgi:cystathionine beta-lyase/cystathionine gamma-synthase
MRSTGTPDDKINEDIRPPAHWLSSSWCAEDDMSQAALPPISLAPPTPALSPRDAFIRTQGRATRAVRAGRAPDATTGAVVPPICQSTTFAQRGDRLHDGHSYSRVSNPTVSALEEALGALEDAPPAVAFTSGMAAITALILATCSSGDEIIVSEVAYGGTIRLCERILQRLGIRARYVDASDPARIAAAIGPHSRIILLETPANPTLDLADVAAIAAIARGSGVRLAIDNTFLTPIGLRPLDLGADVSVVSTTKYVDGHDATTGGAITTHDADLLEQLRVVRKTVGSIQSPFEAWLTLQGLKTLPFRFRLHAVHALEVARILEGHPRLRSVRHPGLRSFPQVALAARQHLDGLHGGIVTIDVDGDLAATRAFLSALRLCTVAENLGAAETLVTHPATMTHGDVPAELRRRAGIGDSLVRISVGLEDPEDILADILSALDAVPARAQVAS